MSVKVLLIGAEVLDAVIQNLSEAAQGEILGNIAEAARGEWIRLASMQLHSTRADYINGIQPVAPTDNGLEIVLVGVLPNLVEQGMSGFDLHDTLLGPGVPIAAVGDKGKHMAKDGGFFRAIPYRHQTPGSNGLHGKPMPKPIYAQAKKLKATVSQFSGQSAGAKTSWGGRLPEGLAAKAKPYHATDLFAGMVREEKTYEKATQNQYTTFRMIAVDASGAPRPKVGSDGATSKWIHPGITAAHLADQVSAFADTIAQGAFEAWMQEAI